MEALSGYREGRLNLFKWRSSLSWRYKFALSIGFAGITGIAAQIMIILPWTPVPLTAQTFPVLVGAVLLGRSWGSVSQVLYVALGVLGVPWFFGMSGGYEHLLGASGGYLLGFIVAAWVIGYISDRYVLARRYIFMLMLFMVGMLIIYAMGLIQLYLWLYTFS
ncbi:MAG: biotin transporter BioY, partial [Methermicoccaceae archaeon]